MDDFEISEGESERTRALYDRLLDRTKHYKCEASAAEQEEDEEEEDQEEIDAIELNKECIRRT
ncbi:hypothetical protein HID58_003141 [Brassica napus]|uniref:Uncharacterized protein n=1 Tax=Brassica napus TaxID=3708 RepID=A0ABQ8CLS5_BRANA|nr:hypothetical protein HID58_025648 [Brassica napus]KAH0943504.1 hypothetical protein HID58_003141 [Brassica napus]